MTSNNVQAEANQKKNKNNLFLPNTTNFASRFTDYYDEFEHCHNFYEIVFINYGTIEHHANNDVKEMKPGDAFLLMPGVDHFFKRKGQCAHRDVMISEQTMQQTFEYIDKSFFNEITKNEIVYFHMNANQIKLFDSSYNILDGLEDINARIAYEKVICCQLLGNIYTNAHVPTIQVSNFKNKCLTTINEQFKQKNILETLRETLGYTQSHFCKKFKSEFSMTPTDYINQKRITIAADILLLSNSTIEECCYSVGFDSIPHFIKLFKQHYGTTPAKYRRSHKNNV